MDLQQQIRELKARIDVLENRDFDLKGRRVVNAGRALSASDLLTFGQAKELLSSPETQRIIEQHVSVIQGGPFGAPLTLGSTNSQGASGLFSDAQHIHASGLTTKGDLLGYGTATQRVAVGATNGVPLIVDSAQTAGIAYNSAFKGARSKTLVSAAVTDLFEFPLTSITVGGGFFSYLVRAQNATDAQGEAGFVRFATLQDSWGFASTITKDGTAAQALTTGGPSTLAVSFTINTASNKATVRVQATSDITPTTLDIRFFLDSCDGQTVTFL